VPSQGDAVLIGLLGNGKALEVARDAATSLLPADNSKHEVNTTWQKSDHAIDLEALAVGALNVVNHHTAYAATAPNDRLWPPLSKDRILCRLLRLFRAPLALATVTAVRGLNQTTLIPAFPRLLPNDL
jgi:hypothetical protein